jgi:DNA-binding winged helix-turn-helix (wHTH) protein
MPILILSDLDEADSIIRGLGLGADDYVTRPFDQCELIARMHVVVGSVHGRSGSVVRTGNVEVNFLRRTVRVNDQSVHITGREYGILALLSVHKGTMVTKDTILTHLYAGMVEPDLKIIDVFMCRLRRKLSEAGVGDDYIKMVWGRGYVMDDPPEIPCVDVQKTLEPAALSTVWSCSQCFRHRPGRTDTGAHCFCSLFFRWLDVAKGPEQRAGHRRAGDCGKTPVCGDGGWLNVGKTCRPHWARLISARCAILCQQFAKFHRHGMRQPGDVLYGQHPLVFFDNPRFCERDDFPRNSFTAAADPPGDIRMGEGGDNCRRIVFYARGPSEGQELGIVQGLEDRNIIKRRLEFRHNFILIQPVPI